MKGRERQYLMSVGCVQGTVVTCIILFTSDSNSMRKGFIRPFLQMKKLRPRVICKWLQSTHQLEFQQDRNPTCRTPGRSLFHCATLLSHLLLCRVWREKGLYILRGQKFTWQNYSRKGCSNETCWQGTWRGWSKLALEHGFLWFFFFFPFISLS